MITHDQVEWLEHALQGIVRRLMNTPSDLTHGGERTPMPMKTKRKTMAILHLYAIQKR
jgi:hypothetical protein